MLRMVRPLKRKESANAYFSQRIPADVQAKAIGLRLRLPIGDEAVPVTISKRATIIKVSLRTSDPSEVKLRQANVVAYLEKVWQALRQATPITLTQRQATSLSGILYRAWADEERGRTLALTHDPQTGEWERTDETEEVAAEWAATLGRWAELEEKDLEPHLGPLVDRLLLSKGIGSVDPTSRDMLLVAFWRALRDAFENRGRHAAGDYRPDPNSERFPAWVEPGEAPKAQTLTALVEDWWAEAKTTNLAVSTYESYRNTMGRFVTFLGHDDAMRVTPSDVIRFKAHRLSEINPRTGKPISAKTVKDSDLAGLRSVFRWAVANRRMFSNPAEGITIKLGKQTRTRAKGFTDKEARLVLTHALHYSGKGEFPKTTAAKRWAPWLCAYSGARVGEILQLRKEDIKQEDGVWFMNITPEAGTVKTKEARTVPIHPHLIELGFVKFVRGSPAGHLFLTPSEDGGVRGPWRGVKNRVASFVREVVTDAKVAPNHGWRHLFKTIGIEADIQERVLDAICGHAPRTVGGGYGDVSMKAKVAAMEKFTRFRL